MAIKKTSTGFSVSKSFGNKSRPAVDKDYPLRTESDKQEEILDGIGDYVRTKFNQAVTHKRIIQSTMLECLRQRKGIYDPGEQCVDGVDVYMNISSKAARTVESWISDVFAANVDKPWTLSATPIPSLSDASKKMVLDEIKRIVSPEILSRPGVLQSPTFRAEIKKLKGVAAYYENEIAKEAASRMSKRINDQMIEGGFREAFSSALPDLSTFPAMIIKSPVYKRKKTMQWDGASVKVVDKVFLCTERVSPFDIYPAPTSSSPTEGYICEIMRFEPGDLYDCIGMPNFNGDKIKHVIDKYPTGYRVQDWTDAERLLLEKGGFRALTTHSTLDVIDFWGRIPGKLLREWGVTLPKSSGGDGGGAPELDSYEANVWFIDGVCIRALLNPNPLGDRPYRVTSYEKVPGAFMGNGPLQLIRDVQRVCNASARNMVRNMSYSAGPIAEVEAERLADEETFDEIVPYKVYFANPDPYGGGRPAIRITQIPSVAAELMGVYDRFERMADERVGIPRSADGTGGAQPRTIGVFSMQMANASKGIKAVIHNIEMDIIEPTVRAFWVHNMLHDEDESIKGDVNIVCRGASGLLQAEHLKMQQREFLALLPPFLGALDPSDLKAMLRQMAEGLDLKFSFTVPGAIGDALAGDRLAPGGVSGALSGPGGVLIPPGGQSAPVGVSGGPLPATQRPPLDGRSLSQVRS